MIYYRRYVKAFIGDTQALSMAEQGGYDRLLDHYYETETPIPLGREMIIARAMTASERKAVTAVLERFFSRGKDGWHNKRADHEIAMAKKARANGAKGDPNHPPDTPPDSTPEAQGDGTPDATPDTPPDEDILSAFKPRTILSTLQPPNLPPNPVAPQASPASRRKAGREPPPTAPAWEAYREAYAKRYGTDPVRNAVVNAHLARFVKRVGAAEAPAIAAFYLTHSRSAYVASKHDSKFLDMDAEGLRTEWATGQRVTQTQATQADRTQATGSVFQSLIAEAEARERIA